MDGRTDRQMEICNSRVAFATENKFKPLLSVFNIMTWMLDVLADLIAVIVGKYDFFLASSLHLLVSAGLTPVVYMVGGRDNSRNNKIGPTRIHPLPPENIQEERKIVELRK